jgi:LPXTG-site transpeptidase (sortase) family protein
MTTKNKQPKGLPFIIILLSLFAGVGISFVVYTAVNGKATVTQPIASGAGSDNADVVAEASEETPVPVQVVQKYTVPNDEPRMLKIDSLGINARIRPMGINSIQAISAPVNIHDSGWYIGSSKPGAPGAMFIDGHASGTTRKGLFAYLDTMKDGNVITIERGDGQSLNYQVVHVETVPKDTVDMSKVLSTYGGAAEGLNLMTCTGTWLPDQKTYDKRAIVYTTRIQ